MSLNKVIPLNWDSKFFGYEVAKISFNQSGNVDLENLFQEIKTKRIRLTYLLAPPTDTELNKNIARNGGILVDQKVIYSKTTQAHSKYTNNIIEFTGKQANEKLIELALRAGVYSRFLIDKNFKNWEFERLYTHWLLNSLNKSIAFKIVVALSNTHIVGLVTLGEKENQADIGLVSVDKNFGRRGIGSDLINFADNAAYELKYKNIKVTTQLQNTSACKLYEKCNFILESTLNVYHFWQ
jgi:dTDP-4-amino-4,6-dideoxy-D-galactose acyltransferase